jgi:hypothetical protein
MDRPVPKQKPRDNRKARRKRDRDQLERLAHKRFDAAYRARGVSPRYYDVAYPTIRTKVAGRRVFDLAEMRIVVRPNAKYQALVAALVRMSAGVTVDISGMRDRT